MPPIRNVKFEKMLSQSKFLNLSRLARHLGVHYRNVESYALLERKPVDRQGIVKYDVAEMCNALECTLEDLFPDEFIDRPYRFRDTYQDGHGRRSPRGRVIKRDSARRLTIDQAGTVVGLLDVRKLVPDDGAMAVAEELVQRLSLKDFNVFIRMAFEGMTAEETADSLGIIGTVARNRYRSALRQLNSPATVEVIRAFKASRQQVPLTKELREELESQRCRTGEPARLSYPA